MRRASFILTAWAALAATPASAWEASAGAGRTRLIKCDLLDASTGDGEEATARLAFDVPAQTALSAGIYGASARYAVGRDEESGGTTLARSGALTGRRVGLETTISPGAWSVRPLLRVAYFLGTYDYDVETVTTRRDEATFETSTDAHMTLAASGFVGGLGAAWTIAAGLGLAVEYRETREVVEVRDVSFRHATTVDGVKTASDGGVFDASMQELVGTRYGQADRGVLVSLFWRR